MRPSRVLTPVPSLTLLSLFALTVLVTPGGANAQLLAPSQATSHSLRLMDSQPEPLQPLFTSDERREAALDSMGTHAYLIYYGLTRGAFHGVLLTSMLGLDQGGAGAAIGAVGGGLAAYSLADGMTPGRAHVIGTALDFGLIVGIGVDLAAEANFDWDRPGESPATFALPLALSLGGAFLSAQLVDARNLTWGDMELVHMSGLVGGLLGAGALGHNEPTIGAGMLLGSAVGLLAGSFLITDQDFSLGQSLLMDLGTVALGVSARAVADGAGGTDRAVAISAGLGAALGLGLTYLLLSPYAHVEAQKPPLQLSLQFSPGSLGTRDTQTGRPAPTSLMLQGQF